MENKFVFNFQHNIGYRDESYKFLYDSKKKKLKILWSLKVNNIIYNVLKIT